MKLSRLYFFAIALLACTTFPCQAKDKEKNPLPTNIDFVRDVKPIFEAACVNCHDETNYEEDGADYRMDTRELAFKGGNDYNPSIVSGKPNESPVWWMTTEPPDGDIMPAKPHKNPPLTKIQQDILEAWVKEGAKWPDGVTLAKTPRLRFKVNILPILKKGPPFSEKNKFRSV